MKALHPVLMAGAIFCGFVTLSVVQAQAYEAPNVFVPATPDQQVGESGPFWVIMGGLHQYLTGRTYDIPSNDVKMGIYNEVTRTGSRLEKYDSMTIENAVNEALNANHALLMRFCNSTEITQEFQYETYTIEHGYTRTVQTENSQGGGIPGIPYVDTQTSAAISVGIFGEKPFSGGDVQIHETSRFELTVSRSLSDPDAFCEFQNISLTEELPVPSLPWE